jgi:hypothetical protein
MSQRSDRMTADRAWVQAGLWPASRDQGTRSGNCMANNCDLARDVPSDFAREGLEGVTL